MKILKVIIGIIVFIIGLFYTFMPHTIHIASGIGFGLTHNTHVVVGIISLIVGIIILFFSITKH